MNSNPILNSLQFLMRDNIKRYLPYRPRRTKIFWVATEIEDAIAVTCFHRHAPSSKRIN